MSVIENDFSYQIKVAYWLVRDAENEEDTRLNFHVKSGDYFSTLATILGFIEEKVGEQDYGGSLDYELNVLKRMKKDLLYLNDNFDITRKNNNKADLE
ncbi:MAG: hypothetical protein H6779_05155 [Candidatus Nomurabacteria bacterium]|nr:hypothetical protein [Candidatus Nomurabacteria bacterium]USN87756.1 MAG: hypothetical protein H6779_05155 [Candidatus Nomurabacteria bacterium]